MYASACAVARAFPLYSKKTSGSTESDVATVSVEFVIVGGNNGRENSVAEGSDLSPLEITALDDAASGIRLAARIVDTPCNEMNVDHFLEVISVFFTVQSAS